MKSLTTEEGIRHFLTLRFGLFVHWGLYAINGYHEQELWRARKTRAEYEPLMQRFNPTRFNADAWLDVVEAAGMRYITVTTKHCDGFCLWNSDVTDYSSWHSPARADYIERIAEACARRDVPLALYYSGPDMHQPNYPHENRRYEFAESPLGDRPDIGLYLDYVRTQVRELCTRYGRLLGFFWDGADLLKVSDPSMNAMIRELQPGIVINDRGFGAGDLSTPERMYTDRPEAFTHAAYPAPTEACESIGAESWGFRTHEDYFTLGRLTRRMAWHWAKGGNFLLNIGPEADGSLPETGVDLLRRIGEWKRRTAEAFDGTTLAPGLTDNKRVLMLRRGDTLYVVCTEPLDTTGLWLDGFRAAPVSATVLNTGTRVLFAVERAPSRWNVDGADALHLWDIPADTLSNEAVVIKLTLRADV